MGNAGTCNWIVQLIYLRQSFWNLKWPENEVRKIRPGNGQASLLIREGSANENIDLWSSKRRVELLDVEKENGANEHVKKTLLDAAWPLFNEKEMLVNLPDRCPCCLELYQLIRSYPESVFFYIQAGGGGFFTLIGNISVKISVLQSSKFLYQVINLQLYT